MNTAKDIAYYIHQEMIEFQNDLKNSDDIFVSFIPLVKDKIIQVTNVGYIGDSLIFFEGTNSSGRRVEVVQHMSQVNYYMTSAPRKDPEHPRRQIGFVQNH